MASKSLDRQVRFADEAGVCQTMEGPVRYESGDALVTGTQAEEWPISIDKFNETYRPVGSTNPGHSGTYRKAARDGLAIQLSAPTSLVLSDGRGVLQGKPRDWVVDYGNGDLSLVARELFSSYYESNI